LTVNGFADESSLQRKQNIQIGDALILTKPLGTGVVIAADGRGAVSETQFASAIETMCLSNVAALSVLQQYPLHGLTDVTGFGLGGHLMEMLIGQSMTGRLSTAAIPVIDGITLLYDQGYRSSLHAGNESRYRVFMRGEDALHPLLYDPQTSGPLLAAVARAEAPACVAELHAQGYRDAAVIGMIEDAGDGPGGISIEPVDLLLEPV
jgi:selenide,water dikinase